MRVTSPTRRRSRPGADKFPRARVNSLLNSDMRGEKLLAFVFVVPVIRFRHRPTKSGSVVVCVRHGSWSPGVVKTVVSLICLWSEPRRPRAAWMAWRLSMHAHLVPHFTMGVRRLENFCRPTPTPGPGGVSVIIFRKRLLGLGIWANFVCHPLQTKVGLHFGWTPPNRAEALYY